MPTQRVFEEVEQFYMDNFMSSDINVSCKIGDRLFCMFCFSKKKHYFALVSKQCTSKINKFQQNSLWSSHQSDRSPLFL